MPPAARSVEELFPLIEFCKNGDLKAVSEWIAKGNPLDLPSGKKTRRASPLQIAIEKGFLTSVLLLFLALSRRPIQSVIRRFASKRSGILHFGCQYAFLRMDLDLTLLQ